MNIGTNFNNAITSPQFRANENVTKPTDLDEKKGLGKGAKWAIGTGLAILGTYGVYALTKGKVKPTKRIDEIKELSIKAFKEAGNKFDKCKAVLADGTKYTGNITSECKDGSKVVMEYVDGVLQKSTKTAKDGSRVFDKAYFYTKDGSLEKIEDGFFFNNTIWKKVISNEKIQVKTYRPDRYHYYILDKNSGKLLEHSCNNREEKVIDRIKTIHSKKYIYSDEGILKYQILNHNNNDEKILLEFYPDGKTIKTIVDTGKTAIYDEKGELLYKLVDKGYGTTYSGKKIKYLMLDEGNELSVDFSSDIAALSPDDCVKYNLSYILDIVRTVSLREKNPLRGIDFWPAGFKKDGKIKFSYNDGYYKLYPISDKDNKYAIWITEKKFAEFDSMTGAIKILDNKYTIDDAKKAIESANTYRKKIKSLYRKALEIQKESQDLRTTIQNLG